MLFGIARRVVWFPVLSNSLLASTLKMNPSSKEGCMKGAIFDLFDTVVLSEDFPRFVAGLFPGIDHQCICDIIYTRWFGSPQDCIHAVVAELGLRRHIPCDEEHFVAQEFLEWAASRPLSPNVHSVLTTLRERGFQLALLSNTSELLDPVLERHNLLSYFHVAHLSYLTQHPKPSREAFLGCLEDLRLQPSEVVMIGDSIRVDVQGAMALGIRAVHVDWKDEAQHEPRVTQLAQLLELPELQSPS